MSVATQMVEESIGKMGLRQDTKGKWYAVSSTPCDKCGCPYDFSIDELGVVWEAGPDIEDECSDPECECHTAPIIGLPFLIHVGL